LLRREITPGVPDRDRPTHLGFTTSGAAVFFVIAIIAAVFGFGGIAVGAAGIAKILFFLFIILAVVSLIFGRGRTSL